MCCPLYHKSSLPLTDSKETVEYVAEFYGLHLQVAENLCRDTSAEKRQENIQKLHELNAALPANELKEFEEMKSVLTSKRQHKKGYVPFSIDSK